jgi:hypothetical protein
MRPSARASVPAPDTSRRTGTLSGRLARAYRALAGHLLASTISLPFFAGLCAVADGLTTVLALESGLGYELNSFAPTSLPGVIFHTFVKLAATQYVDEVLPNRYADLTLKLCCAIWGAAAISNCFAIMHAPVVSSALAAAGFISLLLYSFRTK